jgi:hypothetical protein
MTHSTPGFSRAPRTLALRSGLAAGIASLAFAGAAQAGLNFVVNYSAAVQANPDYINGNIPNAVNYVKNEFSSRFTDNITLRFTIDQNTSGLGQSLFSSNYWRGSYTALRTALVNDVTTANDTTATAAANLPAADPYGAGATGWYATSAEAKALGLITDQSLFDGTYTFNASPTYVDSNNMVQPATYTFDPNNRGGAAKYDFIGVTEHEFSELMGRTSQIRNAGFGYDILDTMRFTAPGTRDATSTGSGVYFSFANGNNALAGYNAGNGDIQDWNGSIATDPFNAGTDVNQAHSMNSSPDDVCMDVIGYDRVPAPSSLVLLGGGLLAVRRRRR